METAQIVAIAGSIGTVLASAISVLYKANADAIKGQLKQANETIEYERSQKEQALAYSHEQNKEATATMNMLINAVEGIGPVVSNDGGKTRAHVSESAHQVIRGIKD